MKSFLIIILLYFSTLANCQTKDTTIESISGNKYTISTRVIPIPTGFINDFSDIYTVPQELILDSLVTAFAASKDVQIVIVSIPANYLPTNEDFDNYTLRLAKTWGVGKPETNKGIVIAISPDLRRIRIHNGYGIEKLLSDIENKQIIEEKFLPNLKSGNYFEATKQGLIAIVDRIIKNGA